MLEIEIVSIQGTNLTLYHGNEALQTTESTTIGSSDTLIQYSADRPLYLLAYLTSDKSSFKIEFHRTLTVTSEKDENGKAIEQDVFGTGLDGEELYKIMFVSAVVITILVLLFAFCSRLLSRKKESAEHNENQNGDMNILKRLDTTKGVNDSKYAAKTRAEVLAIMAKKMEFSSSYEDEENEESGHSSLNTDESTFSTAQNARPAQNVTKKQGKKRIQADLHVNEVIQEMTEEEELATPKISKKLDKNGWPSFNSEKSLGSLAKIKSDEKQSEGDAPIYTKLQADTGDLISKIEGLNIRNIEIDKTKEASSNQPGVD